MQEQLNGYQLTRQWFDFAFENQELVTPTHTAMYLWFVELNNRLAWMPRFASPASQTMAAIGLKSYNTYKKVFSDLVVFEFVQLVKESKNQYTACIIALSNFDKAQYKALDKALIKHVTEHELKQSESTRTSTDSIIKQETIKQETINNKQIIVENKFSPSKKIPIEERVIEFKKSLYEFTDTRGGKYSVKMVESFFNYWSEQTNTANPKMKKELQKTWETEKRLLTWSQRDIKIYKNGNDKKHNSTAIIPRGKDFGRF